MGGQGGAPSRPLGFPQGENRRGCWCPGVWALSWPDAASASLSLSPSPGWCYLLALCTCRLCALCTPRAGLLHSGGRIPSPQEAPTPWAPQGWAQQAGHRAPEEGGPWLVTHVPPIRPGTHRGPSLASCSDWTVPERRACAPRWGRRARPPFTSLVWGLPLPWASLMAGMPL